MKLWVTKYALTQGIFQSEFEDVGDGWVKEMERSGSNSFRLFLKRSTNTADTLEEAKAVARSMATKKIASIEKQIAKLRKLEREPKVVE